MTEQFANRTINLTGPQSSRRISADDDATTDDDLIVVDSSINPVTLTLFRAYENPGFALFIQAPFSSTNPVTLAAAAGETIDGSPTLVFSQDQGILLKAESQSNSWRVISNSQTTSAAGPSGSVQFNNVGSFAGISEFSLFRSGGDVALGLQPESGGTDVGVTLSSVLAAPVGSFAYLGASNVVFVGATALTTGLRISANAVQYDWPTSDGNPGDVLTTDGAGTMSWGAGGGGSVNLQGDPVIFDLDFAAGPTLDLKSGGDVEGFIYEGITWDIGGTAVASDVGFINGTGFRIVNNTSLVPNDGCWLSIRLFDTAAGTSPVIARLPDFDPGLPWRMTVKFERVTPPSPGSQVYQGITKQPFNNCSNSGAKRNWVAQANTGGYFGAKDASLIDSLGGTNPAENVIVLDVDPRLRLSQYIVTRGVVDPISSPSLPLPYLSSGMLSFPPQTASLGQESGTNAYLYDQTYIGALRPEAQLTRIFIGTDLNGEVIFRRWRLEQRAAR